MIQPRECEVIWPLGWLATYSGSGCRLWRLVYEKCMDVKLCRETIELLPAIGYNLARHKCYDPALINDLDTEIITPQQAKSSIAHTT
jgi:hypothetical protein